MTTPSLQRCGESTGPAISMSSAKWALFVTGLVKGRKFSQKRRGASGAGQPEGQQAATGILENGEPIFICKNSAADRKRGTQSRRLHVATW